jgi:thiamine biosynthesis protein ThiI
MKKFISLLSGGLDSPIAAYLMLKKGYEPVFLSFLTSDDLSKSMREKILKIVGKLRTFTEKPSKLYLISHDENLELFKNLCERKLTCILCKRLMLRIAKQICDFEGTNLIVTGDIMGEQASQTLDNLFSYNDTIKEKIVLRPLIGWDKQDVIELNKKLDLYEFTSLQSAGCQFNPQFPETHAKLNEINKSESKLEINDLILHSIKRAEILEF